MQVMPEMIPSIQTCWTWIVWRGMLSVMRCCVSGWFRTWPLDTGSSSSIASTRLAMLRKLRNQLDLHLFSAWPHLEGCQALTVAHRPTLTCSCPGCTKHWLLWRPLTKGWMVIQSFSYRCKTSLQCESKKGGDLLTALHAAQIKFGCEIHRQSLPWVRVAQLELHFEMSRNRI